MMNPSSAASINQIATFRRLVAICTGIGTNYQPGRAELSLTELENLCIAATEATTAAVNAAQTFKDTINQRRVLLKLLPERCTRVVNYLSVSGLSEKGIKDARVFLHNIQGRASKSSSRHSAADPTTETTERMKRNLIENRLLDTERLIALVASTPGYAPNEPELQLNNLQAFLAEIRSKNIAVETTAIADKNTRITRDDIIYHRNNSIVNTALRVKKYIAAAFGTKSSQFKQAKGLRFTKRRA